MPSHPSVHMHSFSKMRDCLVQLETAICLSKKSSFLVGAQPLWTSSFHSRFCFLLLFLCALMLSLYISSERPVAMLTTCFGPPLKIYPPPLTIPVLNTVSVKSVSVISNGFPTKYTCFKVTSDKEIVPHRYNLWPQDCSTNENLLTF